MTDPSDRSSGPPPHPSYPYPPYPPSQPYPPVTPPLRGPRNGLGTASLVFAVVALLCVWSVFGGVILGGVAIVLGIVGYGRVRRGEANNGGVAIAGIVLGGMAIVVGPIFVAIWTALWHDIGGGDYIDCLQRAGSNPALRQRCAERLRQNVEDRFSVTLTPRPPLP
jgi:hypothetical protein